MRKIYFYSLFAALLIGGIFLWRQFGAPQLEKALVAQIGTKISSGEPAPFEIKTFPNGDGWGYDVYVKGQLFIHQPHIPAVSGSQAFKLESDAFKTARMVMKKLKKDPSALPTVSTDELKEAGVWGEK